MSDTTVTAREPWFNEEHEVFRRSLRAFVQTELAPHAEEWEEAGGFPEWVWTRLGELGYLNMEYPEEYGGQNCDFMFRVVFSEELSLSRSYGLCASVVGNNLSVTVPYKFGSEEIKQRYVKPSIQGKKIAAIGMTEPGAGSDLASVCTRAERTRNGWVINGQKVFVTNGPIADFIVVLARTAPGSGYKGMSTFIVDKHTPGLSTKKMSLLGWHTSEIGEVSFEDCEIPAHNLIGEEGRGFYQIMWELVPERLLQAAGNTSRAQIAFNIGLDYVKQRVQFGQPVANFQSIQHRFADMATQIDATRQLTHYASWLHSNGGNPIRESSEAKLMAAQVGFKVTDEVLQMFGGYGLTMDNPVQRYWRDMRLYRFVTGTDEIQKEIISGQLFHVPKR